MIIENAIITQLSTKNVLISDYDYKYKRQIQVCFSFIVPYKPDNFRFTMLLTLLQKQNIEIIEPFTNIKLPLHIEKLEISKNVSPRNITLIRLCSVCSDLKTVKKLIESKVIQNKYQYLGALKTTWETRRK